MCIRDSGIPSGTNEMTRTLKLPYEPTEGLAQVLADQRRRQGRLIRSAYRLLASGLAQRDLYQALRSHPVGKGLHLSLIHI